MKKNRILEKHFCESEIKKQMAGKKQRTIMKRLGTRMVAGLITTAICLSSTSTVFAADTDGNDFFSSVGGWFSDRGEDLQNAGNCVGGWFADRGEDICEVSKAVGNWTGDRANDIQVFVTDTGDWIVCAASAVDVSKLTTAEYYLDSGEKLLLGDYSEKDPTALSMGLNLTASVLNVDLGMDVRDLVYDIQNYGSEEVTVSGLALDAIAIIPVIGVLKNLKYVDTVADSVKVVGNMTDAASDIAKGVDTAIDAADSTHDVVLLTDTAVIITDSAKLADQIDDANDTVKLIDSVSDLAKVSDFTDDVTDSVQVISKIQFDELPEKVQETYKVYADNAWDGKKALKKMADKTKAGVEFKNRDGDLPILDKMGNALSYTEYDAYPFGEDPDYIQEGARGAARFVRDNFGNIYFSDDHYNTFKLISEAVA